MDGTSVATASLVTFLISLGLMPVAVVLGRRFGMVVTPRLFGRSFESVSYLGGAGVAASLGIAFVVGAVLYNLHSAVWAAFLGAFMLLAFGIADDRVARDMPPLGRLFVQAMTAMMVWSAGLHPTPTDIPWLDMFLTVFFILAATNSFNLLDNMDGIAGSTAAATLGGIAVIAASTGQEAVALLAATGAGAALGFVPHNVFYKRIYLGNGGSLFLGFLVGCLTLLLDFPLNQPWGFASAIAILVIPATDTTLVLVSRLRAGRSIFEGGVDHLSHRLAYLGASTRTAALFHGVASIGGAASVVVAIQTREVWVIPATLLLFGALLVGMLRIDVYERFVTEDEEGRPLAEHHKVMLRKEAEAGSVRLDRKASSKSS